jgi:hypothetical protein
MPPAKSQQQQIDAANDNILVIVGRLLAATEAASDGIKTLSEETKQNSAAAQAAKQAVESIQQTVLELDRIVRNGSGNNGGLVTQVRLNSEEMARLRKDHSDLSEEVTKNTGGIAALEKEQATTTGSHTSVKTVIIYVVGVVGWAITTAVALYAALKGN